jgi:hypothetical protein
MQVQGILLQTRTVHKPIKMGIIAAQFLRPLRPNATNVVYVNRIVDPSEDSPFLEWLHISLLQKVDQVVSNRPRFLWSSDVSEAGDDKIRMDSNLDNPRRSPFMIWECFHPLGDVVVPGKHLEDLWCCSVKRRVNDLQDSFSASRDCLASFEIVREFCRRRPDML